MLLAHIIEASDDSFILSRLSSIFRELTSSSFLSSFSILDINSQCSPSMAARLTASSVLELHPLCSRYRHKSGVLNFAMSGSCDLSDPA